MSTNKTTVTLTLSYTNTDFTRKMKFEDPDPYIWAQATALGAIREINASLAAGTDDELADFFRSDDYDASNSNKIVGRLERISGFQCDEVTVTDIPLD